MNSYNQKGSRGSVKQNESAFHRSRDIDIETVLKDYPTSVTISPRENSEDGSSQTHILGGTENTRYNIMKTTEVDIRYDPF